MVTKLRIDSKGQHGGWEEIVDNAKRRTLYYHAERDEIRFNKPENWVHMLVNRFSSKSRDSGESRSDLDD